MKHTSIPPFYVGQEVVCINPIGRLVKDKKYTVLGLFQCKVCKKWQIGFCDMDGDESGMKCPCGWITSTENAGPYRFAYAHRFAPITSTFQSITLEKVLEEETKLIGVN